MVEELLKAKVVFKNNPNVFTVNNIKQKLVKTIKETITEGNWVDLKNKEDTRCLINGEEVCFILFLPEEIK